MAEVFVTGATGFLGQHLCAELLEWGANVTALVRKAPKGRKRRVPEGVEVRTGDLSSPGGKIIPDGTEYVFHLAASTSPHGSVQDPTGVFEVNAVSTARLLEEIRRRDMGISRFLMASTSLVYAPAPGSRQAEGGALQPASPYAASKAAAEVHALTYDKLYEVPVTVVRVFNCYGPHQSADFVVPSVLRQCLAGGDVRLGNTWPIRDFIFARDVVDLFWRAASSPKGRGEAFNAGTGKGTSIEELARTCLALTGSKGKIVVESGRRRQLETDYLVADPTKGRDQLEWSAATPLTEGLLETAAFLRAAGN